MPSAEETTYLIEVMPDTKINQESYTSHDVDVLVSRIKQNLRLSSLKSRSSLVSSQKLRMSPYRLPSRTWAELGHHHHRRYRKSSSLDLDDSYERFQALLHSGALIKEAVKRLQSSSDDDLVNDDEDKEEEDEDDDDKHRQHHFFVRRKHFDYDSEDEPNDVEI
ncbi:uncharacterized protein LOC106637097 [Copidosoma floridanum]|uniref:uncharacterized protein LOC106637097 n=1 Tax=Copidosoma floridanum TaxID=29053 RepID=UPI000C6F9283|nr:uncharacterized protein LOC106637097 [Copidosoma floridanum]